MGSWVCTGGSLVNIGDGLGRTFDLDLALLLTGTLVRSFGATVLGVDGGRSRVDITVSVPPRSAVFAERLNALTRIDRQVSDVRAHCWEASRQADHADARVHRVNTMLASRPADPSSH